MNDSENPNTIEGGNIYAQQIGRVSRKSAVEQLTIATLAIITRKINDTQSKLDSDYLNARHLHLAAIQDAATAGLDQNAPEFPFAALVASTVQIGDEKGYPSVRFPVETQDVLRSACNAGIFPHASCFMLGNLNLLLSGVGLAENVAEWQADHDAWSVATEYGIRNRR